MTIKVDDPIVTETPTAGETPPAPTAETPPAETPAAEPQELKLTSAELQRRLDSAAANARREERRKREDAERERDSLKRRVEAGARPLPPDVSSFTREDGTVDSGKHREALIKHEDALHTWRQAQVAPPPSPSGPEATLEQAAATFLERAAPLKQKYADFDQVVNAPVFTPAMQEAIFESDVGPELAYFLGKNRQEADRIAGLQPAQMLREIGRLEARFAPNPRAISGAPSPITPITGTAGPAKDPEKMGTEEWMAWNRQQEMDKAKKRAGL